MSFLAVRDEGGDSEFVAGWNAYVEGVYPKVEASSEFYEGWLKAYREFNDGKWPSIEEASNPHADDTIFDDPEDAGC